MSDWRARVVLITGGAGGMGLAFARRFLAAGIWVEGPADEASEADWDR